MSQDLDIILNLDEPIHFSFSLSQISCNNKQENQGYQTLTCHSTIDYETHESINKDTQEKENNISSSKYSDTQIKSNISSCSTTQQSCFRGFSGTRLEINTQLLDYLNYTQGITSSFNVSNLPFSFKTQSNRINNELQIQNEFPDLSPQIPSSIQNLYKSITCTYSDASFVHAIAAQLCQDYLPMDSMSLLKTSLLLSLASISVCL